MELLYSKYLATATLEICVTGSIAMQQSDEELELQRKMRTTGNLPTPIGKPVQSEKRLQFRRWDEAWNRLAEEINENRRARGLPQATDEEISAEIAARRAPEKLKALEQAIRKGIDSLESVDEAQMSASLRR